MNVWAAAAVMYAALFSGVWAVAWSGAPWRFALAVAAIVAALCLPRIHSMNNTEESP